MTIDEIKGEVRKKVKRELQTLLENYEDALANKIIHEIPEYNVNWCAEEVYEGNSYMYATNIQELLDKIAENEVNILFCKSDE